MILPRLPKFDDSVSREMYNFFTRLVYFHKLSTPSIYKGTGSPTTTPNKEGDIFIDTSAGDVYISAGTSSFADWILLN